MEKQNGENILVLGGDGMAGHMIAAYLSEKGYNVATTTRGKTVQDNYYFNVFEYSKLEDVLVKVQPQYVVNCIGVLNTYAEAKHAEAVLINSFLPHYIDSLSEEYGFRFVHMSTDCVFSGKKGGYKETDLPDEVSFYGRSKALGEIKDTKNLTLRTSIIGPDRNENGIGLFHWFMRQNGSIRGFDRVMWSGVTTLQFAKSVEKAMHSNVFGLYHLVNNESISKYNLLRLFQKHMEKTDIIIEEEADTESDKSIINTRTDFDFQIPSYNQMVSDMCDWIRRHKDWYPLYFPKK